MNSKHEWTLLAVLTLVGVGGYRTMERRAEALAAEAEAARQDADAARQALNAPGLGADGHVPDSLILTAPPLPSIAAEQRSSGFPEQGHWRGQSTFADVDADGLLDLVTSIRRWDRSTPADGLSVFRQTPEGGWERAVEGLRRDLGYGGSEVADLDGDGHLDVVFSGHDVTPHAFLGNGDGTWRATERIDIDFISSDIAVGDADGDGTPDLAVMGFYPKEGGLVYFRGDGKGGFERFADLMPDLNYGAEVELVDLDGDERCELIAATDAGMRCWKYDPELEWVDMSEGLPRPAIGGSELAFAVEDIDGDGYAELLRAGMVYDGHPPLQAYRFEEGVWQPYGAGFPGDETYFDVRFAQLDESASREVLLAGKWGLSVLRMTAPGTFERVGRIDDTEGVINTCAADLDGDGVDEIAYVGFGGPRIYSLEDLNATSGSEEN